MAKFAIAMTIGAFAGLMRGCAGVGSGMLMTRFFVHLLGPIQTVGIIISMEIVVTVLPRARSAGVGQAVTTVKFGGLRPSVRLTSKSSRPAPNPRRISAIWDTAIVLREGREDPIGV